MKKGVYLSLLTAVISGVSIFSNAIFVSRTDPLLFTLIRNSAVALLLTIFLVVLGQMHKLRSLAPSDWMKLLLIGAIGGGIPFALFFTGLSQIGPLNGNILQKTLFLWVAVIAVPLLHERISRLQIIGYAVLFLGLFVYGGTFTVLPKTGTWLVLAATVCWAVENVIAKVVLRRISPAIVSWGRMVFGLPFLLIAVAWAGKLGMLSDGASFVSAPILISSLLLTLYVSTWYTALSKAPATLVTSVLVFAPVVTALLTGIILKKPIVQQQAVNLLLLSAGTVLVVIERMMPKKQTPPV